VGEDTTKPPNLGRSQSGKEKKGVKENGFSKKKKNCRKELIPTPKNTSRLTRGRWVNKKKNPLAIGDNAVEKPSRLSSWAKVDHREGEQKKKKTTEWVYRARLKKKLQKQKKGKTDKGKEMLGVTENVNTQNLVKGTNVFERVTCQMKRKGKGSHHGANKTRKGR